MTTHIKRFEFWLHANIWQLYKPKRHYPMHTISQSDKYKKVKSWTDSQHLDFKKRQRRSKFEIQRANLETFPRCDNLDGWTEKICISTSALWLPAHFQLFSELLILLYFSSHFACPPDTEEYAQGDLNTFEEALNKFEQIWTHLNKFWTSLNTFEHVWTSFEQVWSYLNTFEQVLNEFEHIWTPC